MIALYICLLFTLLQRGNATGKPDEPNCLGAPLSLPEDMRKMRDDCFTSYNSTYDPKGREPKDIFCIYICFLKKIGLVSEDNTFLKNPLADTFKKTGFPANEIEPLVKELVICIDNNGSALKNKGCNSIQDIWGCSGKAFQKVCVKNEKQK